MKNLTDQPQVLDAAIELLGVYQSEFKVRAIDFNMLSNGDIEVSLIPSTQEDAPKIPYGRIDRFSKRLIRVPGRS